MVLAASCLVLGFVGGWVIRGDSGASALLPPAQPVAPQAPPPPVTTSATPPATTPTEAPDRDEVRLAILNGSSVEGLAGRTADAAEQLGYVDVTAGNTVTGGGATTVYFRPGNREAARQVASDLNLGTSPQAVPEDDEFLSEAPADAQVIVVLRSA